MREEMDRKMFISRQTWHFFVEFNLIKVLLPNLTLTWRVD